MRKKLTDRFLESIKPPEAGRDTYSDTLRPGLHLRVGQRKASWVFEKRVKGGPKRKHTLGAWPNMRLAEARAASAEIEAEAVRGQDRIAVAERATLEAERKAETAQTLEAALRQYEVLKLSSLSTGAMVARDLRRVLAKHLRAALCDLTRADLQAPIDDLATKGRLVYANRIRAYLRAFTRWCVRREYIETDIGATLEGTGREEPRDRVLSLTEVKSIYGATYEIGDLFGPMFRLLILTGQRRGEIAALQWTNVEFDQARIVLTGRQTKNRRPHITHLSPPALRELEHMKASATGSLFVFSTTGATPSSGISTAKRRIDKALGEGFEHWRLHDLRRAMATALAGAGVPEGVVDRIQNHAATSSAPSAVARVYQQSDLLDQRAAALDLWADMVTTQTGDVVAMPRSVSE